MAAFLVPLQAGACVIPLEKAILLIGRQADCDVSLTTSRKISRKHCCIAIVNDTVVVRDLGSTNGVSINGNRIEQEGRLRLGDELMIGDVRFRLQKDAQLREALAAGGAPPSGEQAAGTVDLDSKVPVRSTFPDDASGPMPSMDFPVALPEEGAEFVVESTFSKMRPVSSGRKTESSHDSGPLVPMLDVDLDEVDVLPMPSDSI
ncbi:FHA domain-containing protein [bacterium]|nr:FHA domain-containing protein [bacterium]